MNRIQIILGLIASLGFSLVLVACGQSDAKTGSAATPEKPVQAVNVRVEEVHLSPFLDVIHVTGIIKANEDVMLSPEEGGVVKEWLVKKGQTVKRGQVLGILSDDVIKAGYDAALAQYNIANLNYEKQKEVYQERALSELQFRNLEFGRDAAKAQSDLMRARFERTRLRSPIEGIFDDRFVDEGEFAPPGVPIAHIVNLSSIKVTADVTERYTSSIRTGSIARIVVDAFPSDTLEGRISYVGAAISASNRTLPIEITIPNPRMKLKPEMVARVSVSRSERTRAILVNESIVQQVDRGKLVVFVENNGIAEQRFVRLGGRQGSLLEIVEGLRPGDKLIVSGFQRLVHGQAVAVAG